MDVFRTLLATRANTLAVEHIQALNLIDLDFYTVDEVREAWNLYRDHLNFYPNGQSEETQKRWEEKCAEYLADLLYVISSLSGSASAVACGLVDFAIGTDSAGSTRVPASHCGILGMRPTLHRISESGVLPFAPSSSTVAFFANKLTVLEKVVTELLASNVSEQLPINTIYLLEDAFSIANSEINLALEGPIEQLRKIEHIKVVPIKLSAIIGEQISLEFWQENIFSVLQCVEIWNAVGAWIEAHRPEMGPRVQDAMNHFKQFDRLALNHALSLREKMFLKVAQFTKPGDLFCFPTVPMIAPLKGALDDPETCMDYYKRTMSITSFSGVASLPEISVPIAKIQDAPLGLSFAAAHRQDEFLLTAVKKLFVEFL